jgi:hypothetical protein
MLKVLAEQECSRATPRLVPCRVCEGLGWIKFIVIGPCFISLQQSLSNSRLALRGEILSEWWFDQVPDDELSW